MPNNRETLQHRSGRTGRAGRKGVCVILVPHPRRRRVEMLLKSANIEAIWQSAPTAEEMRAKDQERLIETVSASADTSEDDLVVARELMAQRSPEEIAAAYVRLARTRMPAPEDLADNEPAYTPYASAPGGRGERAPEPVRAGFEDAVWFRIDLGRNKNAEARWLLPMLCRRGHLTKRDIGAIRVFERETRFQVTAEAVERFEAAASKGDSDGGRIYRLEEGAALPQRERGPDSGHRRPNSYKQARSPQHAEGEKRLWAPAVDSAPAETAQRPDRPGRPDRPPRPERPAKSFKPKRSKKGKPNG
jgi:ATP-dependent RNA helicase DeaD